MLNLWNNNKLLQSLPGAWLSCKPFPDVNHVTLSTTQWPAHSGAPSFEDQNQVPWLFPPMMSDMVLATAKALWQAFAFTRKKTVRCRWFRCCQREDDTAGLGCLEASSSCVIVKTRDELAPPQSHWEQTCIGTLVICQCIDDWLAALGGCVIPSPPWMFWSHECVPQRISKLVRYACVNTSIFKLHCLLT